MIEYKHKRKTIGFKSSEKPIGIFDHRKCNVKFRWDMKAIKIFYSSYNLEDLANEVDDDEVPSAIINHVRFRRFAKISDYKRKVHKK